MFKDSLHNFGNGRGKRNSKNKEIVENKKEEKEKSRD